MAEITEERPGELLAWRTLDEDFKEAGEMRLTDEGEGATRVRFSVAYDLDSPLLKGADVLGVVERKARSDLQRLKEHLERR